MSINIVYAQGCLGRNPISIRTKDSRPALLLSFANTERFRDKEGARREATNWLAAACYGKVATYVAEVLKPRTGDEVVVVGRLNSYTTIDRGAKRTVLQILAREVWLLKRSRNHPEVWAEDDLGAGDDVPF